MDAESFFPNAIVISKRSGFPVVVKLEPELFVYSIKSNDDSFEPIPLTVDIVSMMGFSPVKFRGVGTYVFRRSGLMIVPVYDTDGKVESFAVVDKVAYSGNAESNPEDSPELFINSFIRPVKSVHELQLLMMVCGIDYFHNIEIKLK